MFECPRCGARVPMAEAISLELEKKLRAKFEAEVVQQAENYKRQIELDTKKQYQGQVEKLEQQLQTQSDRLEMFLRLESELSQREAVLQDQEKLVADRVAELLNQKSKQLYIEIAEKVDRERQLKDLENLTVIEGLRREVVRLNHRVNQGCVQIQGQAGEKNLESILKRICPSDKIERVNKAGDILHTVMSPGKNVCGRILWESKNTQAWQNAWLGKAQKDRQTQGADQIGIVTATLPQSVANIGIMDGVWVAGLDVVEGAALLLREIVYRVAETKHLQGIKAEKLDTLRTYLLSPEFSTNISRIFLANKEIYDSVQRQMHSFSLESQRVLSYNRLSAELTIGILAAFETALGVKLSGNSRPALPGPDIIDLPIAG